jgi:thiol:disulfide interchange protein
MISLLRRFLIAALLLFAAAASARAEYSYTEYSPEVLAAAQATGEPFLVDFFAPWCPTCRAQERVLTSLYSGNSKYNAIPVIRVDWDTWRNSELVAAWRIPRRSTLVLVEGNTELGRIVADTREERIVNLLELAF